MLKEFEVRGYDEYYDLMTKLFAVTDYIICFFCGTLKETGESWCPDSTSALPFVRRGVDKLRAALSASSVDFAFVFVSIDRDDWKGNSRFRSDENLKLINIPTLIKWEHNEETGRLGEEECNMSEKVSQFFEV